MVKIIKNLLLCIWVLGIGLQIKAQLSGTYNVPVNYPTLAAAIADINLQGVNGPLFINISSGYNETAPLGGYSLTATGTVLNPITFRKIGAGPNPIISAFAGGAGTPGTAVQDGVWRLIGSDYVTIDGITINDPNLTNPSTMEYGIGLFKANASNGCQNNTIQNCVITLKRVNNATGAGPAVDGSRAINVVNSLATTQTSALTPTTSSGANSNNKFYGNVIQNCNIGIALIGYAAPSPYTLADFNNDIGGFSGITGNSILNYGGALAATNAAAAIRTLAQYNINVSFNSINNNNGAGANHVTTLRGIYLNTAISANCAINSNTLTLSSAATTAQLAIIENVSGATAASNTVSINNNVISNCTYTTNTSGSFIGIYNNAASSTYLNINNNIFSAISTSATTGSNYLIYNTGGVTSAITVTNNLIVACTNSASSSGAYYAIFNNAVSTSALTMSSNTFSNNSSFSSTGATHLIYNSSATTNSIILTGNLISNCTHSINSSGAFYGIFNNGASTANLDISLNTYINNTVTAFSGPSHVLYNTGTVTNSIVMTNNFISNNGNVITSTGSYFGIYNNAAASSFLDVSNNSFTGNYASATTGSIQLVYNRGTSTNTFITAQLNNNLISNCTFSSSSTSPFLGIYNSGVSAFNLSMLSNTLSSINWLSATSQKFLILNNGLVTNSLNLANNLIASCTSTTNTSGTYNGVYNTGACTVAVNMSNNTFTNNSNTATSGGSYLIFNSGAVASGVITITGNLISGFNNSVTGAADFYGIHNLGTTFSSLNISNNTFTNTAITASTGASNFIYNTGAVTTTITSINLSNNLISNCTSSVNSSGAFYGIYNNAASSGSLTMSNNTFTNFSNYAANGANHLIYNRGAITNTFNLISLNNNLISNCTHSATTGAAFYSIFNNGVRSITTSVTNNTITNAVWSATAATRYLIANWGAGTGSTDLSNNLISNCNNTLNATGIFYGIYNNNNTSVSSGTLNINGNTFLNNNSTATTGETHYINSSGITTNTFSAITITNNVISGITSSVSAAGAFFGIYNNTASFANLNISSNTFTNATLAAFNGPTHLIYNRGVAGNLFTAVTMSNNIAAAITCSINSGGIFYGLYNGGAATTTSSILSIVSNTVSNNHVFTGAGQIYLTYNTCPVSNSISISNNVYSNFTNSLSTTGAFFGISNAGNSSLGDLNVSNNVFTNLTSSATTGGRYLIYNSGAIANSNVITNNLVTNTSHSISSNAPYHIVYNNSGGSGLNTTISSNTFTNNFSSAVNGNTFLFFNSGALTTTLSNVIISNNSIDSYTNSNVSGSFCGIYNAGFTSINLSIATNTLSNIQSLSTSNSRQLIYNTGRVTNTISINDNLITNYTSSLNTSGTFYAIINGVNYANGNYPSVLNITSNRFLNSTLTASNGAIYFINNTGITTNTINSCVIANNNFSNITNTITAGGSFFGIYNAAISSGTMSVNSNTCLNVGVTSTTSARYMIFNGGAIVSSATFSANLFSNFTNAVNTTGLYFGINNGGNSQGNLIINGNAFLDHTLSSTTASVNVIFNSGIISNSIIINNNLVSNFSHSASLQGGFLGIYNSAGSSANINIASNTFTNISSISSTGGNHIIYNRAAVAGTIGNIVITGNLTAVVNYSTSSGSFYGIYNNGMAFSSLSIGSNTFSNIISTSTTSPRYFFYNTGPGSSSISFSNNLVSNYTSSLNTTGVFYGIWNSGNCSGNLSITGNTLSNHILPATTATTHLIYNTGVVSNSVTIDNNLLSGLTLTSTSGFFYGILNNGISSSNISVSGNTITSVNTTNSISPKFFIYNANNAINVINLNNNTVSNYTCMSNTTGNFFGVYNAGISLGNISASGNTLDNLGLAATTASAYMIYNAAAVTNTIDLSSNLISNCSYSSSGAGTFYGIYNQASNSAALNINGNSFNSNAVSVPTVATYMIYSLGQASTNVNSIALNNNSFSNLITFSSSGPFYGIFNNTVSSASLSLSNNTFTNCISTTTGSIRYLVYNTGSVSSMMSLSNNTISNYTSSLNTIADFYGIRNSATCLGSLSMNGNSFVNGFFEATTANTYLVYNTASITNSISMNTNSVTNCTNSMVTTGEFYGIHNKSPLASHLSMNGNIFTNNQTAAVSGNVNVIYNSGSVTNSVIISGNDLGIAFTNNSFNYLGTFYGIYNTGGSSSTTMEVSNNNFSGTLFTGLNGSGNIYFINNANNNSRLDITNNTWTNLTLKDDGNEYLIYNQSSTQAILNVVNNGIVGAYNRTGTAGALFIYYSNGSSSGSCTQVFSGNNFSNITANTQGTGSFYGLYNTDGNVLPYPKKLIFNNTISNINYNGLGFMYNYYVDFLGDGSTTAPSAIYNNTVSSISWSGPLYGIYIGSNVSPNQAAVVYSNTVQNINSSGTTSNVYGAYLLGGGIGLDFYANKVSDCSANGILGVASGLHVLGAVNTRIYNNVIGNINTPVSAASNALNAINIAGGSKVNMSYNSVYLNAVSTSSNFSSNAIYASSSVSLNLQNNIFINNSTPNGTGVSAVFRRSSSALSTYSVSSNNNVFYCGIPSTSRIIFHDGTTSFLTLPSFQAQVSPRDNTSVSENTPFLSTVGGSANFLRINTTLPSLTESGAVNITGITNDIDGQIRQGNPGYTGGGTAPDIGADEYNQSLVPCSAANAGTITVPVSTVKCAGETLYMLSTGYTAAGSIVHQWKVSTTPGGPYLNVSSGIGANNVAYTTGSLNAGTYYYVLATTCTLVSQTASSNEVTVTVNAVPSVTASVVNSIICSGQTLSLTASSNIGTTYNWIGPNSFTSAIQNPIITNAVTNATGIYTLQVSDGNCSSLPLLLNATVNSTPPAFSLTPSAASLCVGSSQTITTSIPVNSPTLNAGSQTNQNTASGYPSPYSIYYGGQKMQMLILAGELSAAGFVTGSPISSLQFSVISLGTNWGTTLLHCQNFMVGMKSTTLASLSSFQSGISNVAIPTNFTPSLGFNNIHNFTAPFIWDGTSNLIIETVFSNSIIGTSANTVIQYNSPTGFQSTLVYRADNQNISSIAAATGTNVNVGFVRPDFRLNGVQVGTYSWSPSIGLSSTNSASVVANPSVTTLYTATLSNGQCESTATMSLSVILIPTLNVISTSSNVCVGNNATLTASGATTYSWSTNATGSVVVVSPFVSTTYTVTGSNPACPNASTTISLISSPALSLNATASPQAICFGQPSTLSVSGASTYTWSGGIVNNSIVVTPTITTNYNVLGYNGPGCWTSKTVLVKVNSLPIVGISPSSSTLCLGESVTFEASGTFNFTWMPGNSNLPLFTVAPVVSTNYTVTGVDLNNCKNTATAIVIVDPCTGGNAFSINRNEIQLFPNPTNGVITLQFEFEGKKSISIQNSLGALIYETNSIHEKSKKIDLSVFAKGIYYVRVETTDLFKVYKVVLD